MSYELAEVRQLEAPEITGMSWQEQCLLRIISLW